MFTPLTRALEKLTIDIKQIETKDWQLDNISLSLFDLQNPSQQLSLSIQQMSLPEPFSKLRFFDIQCKKFNWQVNKIDCETGKAKFEPNAHHHVGFSFSITSKKSRFSIKNLKLVDGSISLFAKQQGKNWQLSIKAKNLKLKKLHAYLSKENKLFDEVTDGKIDVDIKGSGNHRGLNDFLIKALFKQVSLQANSEKTAMESANLEWVLQAKLKNGHWHWENLSHINQGELYQEPVYLKIKDKYLTLKANGSWQAPQGDLQLQQAKFVHQDMIELDMQGLIKADLTLNKAYISSKINDLSLFSDQYILPFVEQTAFDGIKLQGKVEAEIDIQQSAVTKVSVDIDSVSVEGDEKRFVINNAQGIVNWSNHAGFDRASEIQWDQLKIRAIPIEASQLEFLFKEKKITLLAPVSIPLLDGSLDIKQFNWQNTAEDEPKVFFEGGVNQLSLQKLSNAFDWTPLSGNISGYIPGVNYENKTLNLKGELQVEIFKGIIKIKKLSSSGLFTDFSKFSMDMEIDKLDLFEITQKFKMGGMEGRISGSITDLYLENWQPVTFYAWLGTPENDDSKHRISQKAVENIASIGGGGAADLISKGFLGLFDTFMYDRLGFGCYLHQGVCQLMGVEATEQGKGYYLVKGGGIPRIDIIGYNTQVDWNILIERLSRITSTDEVIIK